MARSDRKGAINYRFVPVPTAVLTSAEWASLSHRARVLAFDLLAQFSGKNNGRLCPSIEVMQGRGWTSRDQLAKAKAELLASSFAVQTRAGRPPRTASWIGFTWLRLDWHESMDIQPRDWPLMAFANLADARIDPNEGRERLKRKTVSSDRHTVRSSPKPAVIRPPHGQMEPQS